MKRVRSDPCDAREMVMKVRLHVLVRVVLRIFAFTAVPFPIMCMEAIGKFNQLAKVWLWLDPVLNHPQFSYTFPEAWGIKTLLSESNSIIQSNRLDHESKSKSSRLYIK